MMGMLFPEWSNRGLLLAIFLSKLLVDLLLVALVSFKTGRTSVFSVVAAGLVVLSAAIMFTILQFDVLGIRYSYLEMLCQLVLVGLAGYVVVLDFDPYDTFLYLLAAGTALLAVFASLPIYGEKFVAP